MREKLTQSEHVVKHYNMVKGYYGEAAAEEWLEMLVRTVKRGL